MEAPSLSELTPLVINTGLTQLGQKASIYDIQFKKIYSKFNLAIYKTIDLYIIDNNSSIKVYLDKIKKPKKSLLFILSYKIFWYDVFSICE